MNRQRRIYQEVLGIRTGDIVRTSYDTGPFEVWSITPPSYVEGWFNGLDVIVHLWPTVCLALVVPNEQPRYGSDSAYYGINNVRQAVLEDGASRWFTDQNDEVFVTQPEHAPALPIDMFASYPPIPEPPAFLPGVDYSPRGEDGELHVWNCPRCVLDFNGAPVAPGAHVANCPKCRRYGSRPIYVMPREAGISSYMLALNAGKTYPCEVRRPRIDACSVGEITLPEAVSA